MNAHATASAVRERIIDTACDLFYRQGYRATGINQVIAESGVAKASFYQHFPSKDDLFYEYAKEMAMRDFADMLKEVESMPTPRERFFGPLRILVPWFSQTGWRGCPFQNLMPEIPPEDSRARDVARQQKETMRAFLRKVARELAASEPGLAELDCDHLADTYLLLFEGVLAVSVAYQDAWPVEKAVAILEDCLAKSAGG